MCTLDVINARLDYFDKLNQEAIANGEKPLKEDKLTGFFRFRKKQIESQPSGIPASPAPVVSGEIQMETGSNKRKKRGGKRGLYVKKQGASSAPTHTASGLNL